MRINSSSFFPILLLLAFGKLHSLPAAEPETIVVSVTADRDGAIYKKNETVRFFINVKDEKGKALDWGSVHCFFSDDHYKTNEDYTLALTGQILEVKGKLERPGFLQCEVQFARHRLIGG